MKNRIYNFLLAIGLFGLIAGFAVCYLLMYHNAAAFQQNAIGAFFQEEELDAQGYLHALFEEATPENMENANRALEQYGFTENGLFYIGKEMGLLESGVAAFSMVLLMFLLVVFVLYKKEKAFRLEKQELEKQILLLKENQMEEAYLVQQQKRIQSFIENIAHQIKTPISRVFTSLDIIEESLEDETAKARIEECCSHLENVNALMKRLMDIGRLEAGKVIFRKEPLFLKELLEETVQSCCDDSERIYIQFTNEKLDDYCITEACFETENREHYGDKPASISSKVGIEDLCYYGDGEWLKEAFSNIICNALEADKSGQAVEISCSRTADFIKVAIRDHGSGLREKDIPNIFDRFYLPEEAKANHTGIGLNLAKLIIEGHMGSLYVYNHLEGGAVFQVILPVYESLKVRKVGKI